LTSFTVDNTAKRARPDLTDKERAAGGIAGDTVGGGAAGAE